jgi:hypothetical protein
MRGITMSSSGAGGSTPFILPLLFSRAELSAVRSHHCFRAEDLCVRRAACIAAFVKATW